MKNLLKRQTGQALLIILLVMFVGLTVSLTLLSRTTTDIKLSRQLEESSRAFFAAEAGIEETLRTGIAASPGEVAPGVTYEVTLQEASFGSGVFSLGKLEKENVGTVWLVEHSDPETLDETPFYNAGTILLCWKLADSDIPDIEVIILYKDGSDYKVARGLYKSSDATGGTESCDDSYVYEIDVSLPPSVILLALRLKPIGGDALVAVNPPDPQELPSQGEEIISTGKAGDATRRIRVVKSYPSWPEIFDYVLFSGGGLVK